MEGKLMREEGVGLVIAASLCQRFQLFRFWLELTAGLPLIEGKIELYPQCESFIEQRETEI